MSESRGEVIPVFDMERLLSAIGITVAKRRGDELVALCPGHYNNLGKIDRKASNWSINANTGDHHCFSCGYSGNALSLVLDVTDMGPWEAAKWLRDEGLQSVDVVYRDRLEEQVDDEPLANLAPTYIELFNLFDDPPKSALRSRLIGLSAARHYDIRWQDGVWILPIKSWRGSLMGYQRKQHAYVENVPEGVEKATTLFGIDVFPAGEPAIIVESPLDVARLWYLGYGGGLATFGVEVSDDQIDLVRMFTDRIVLALDNDLAGRASSRKLFDKMHWTVPDLRFFNYKRAERGADGKRPKDVGEMTEPDVHAALRYAVPGVEARMRGLIPEEVKKRGVRGQADAVPGRGVRKNARTRAGTGRIRHGSR